MTDFEARFWNLHDVFLTCSLIRRLMIQAPLERDVDQWEKSDRARLERLWHTQLYVLVEAWRAPDNRTTVEEVGRRVDLSRLATALDMSDSSGLSLQLRNTRNYMSHRDRREYEDPGRTGPIGWLSEANEITEAFSTLFLATIDSLRKAPPQ